MKEILHPESQSPNGVKFHFIDIYLDELSKVGGKEVRSGQTPCGSVTWPQLPRTGRALALPECSVSWGWECCWLALRVTSHSSSVDGSAFLLT